MSRKTIKYTDEPISFRVIEDFLPPPAALVKKEETVKVTIALSKESVDFFKEQARALQTPYQQMLRSVIDHYVKHYH